LVVMMYIEAMNKDFTEYFCYSLLTKKIIGEGYETRQDQD